MQDRLESSRRDGRSYGSGDKLSTVKTTIIDEIQSDVYLRGVGYVGKNGFRLPEHEEHYFILAWYLGQWHIIDYI